MPYTDSMKADNPIPEDVWRPEYELHRMQEQLVGRALQLENVYLRLGLKADSGNS